MERTVLTGAVDELAPRFSGRLVQAGDDGYDEARMVWNGSGNTVTVGTC